METYCGDFYWVLPESIQGSLPATTIVRRFLLGTTRSYSRKHAVTFEFDFGSVPVPVKIKMPRVLKELVCSCLNIN
jgi:hypothetical protein